MAISTCSKQKKADCKSPCEWIVGTGCKTPTKVTKTVKSVASKKEKSVVKKDKIMTPKKERKVKKEKKEKKVSPEKVASPVKIMTPKKSSPLKKSIKKVVNSSAEVDRMRVKNHHLLQDITELMKLLKAKDNEIRNLRSNAAKFSNNAEKKGSRITEYVDSAKKDMAVMKTLHHKTLMLDNRLQLTEERLKACNKERDALRKQLSLIS